MTSISTPERVQASPSPRHRGASAALAPTSENRGRLVVAGRAVEKIAAQAASELAAGRSGGLWGIGARPDPAARPQVRVDLSGDTAVLSVQIGIPFPASVRQVASQVQQRMRDRVQALAGVRVTRVDVEVVTMITDLSNLGGELA